VFQPRRPKRLLLLLLHLPMAKTLIIRRRRKEIRKRRTRKRRKRRKRRKKRSPRNQRKKSQIRAIEMTISINKFL